MAGEGSYMCQTKSIEGERNGRRKGDVPKTKKKAPANEDVLGTKHDIQNQSAPVGDIAKDAKTSTNKKSIHSLNGPTIRKIAAWKQKKNRDGSLENL